MMKPVDASQAVVNMVYDPTDSGIRIGPSVAAVDQVDAPAGEVVYGRPREMRAKRLIRDVPDFPQAGILFKDITPVLADRDGMHEVIDAMTDRVTHFQPDIIVGIESRGFLLGAPIAYKLGLGFVPVRKPGKLPYEKIREDYTLEYGSNTVEMHVDALFPDQRVVIVDDLLATGGTAAAAGRLVDKLGAVVVGYCFLIELGFLGGRALLDGKSIASLINYE